jgi:hypothetical protein
VKLLNRQWQKMDAGSAVLSMIACHFVTVSFLIVVGLSIVSIRDPSHNSLLEIVAFIVAVILGGFVFGFPFEFVWALSMVTMLFGMQKSITIRPMHTILVSAIAAAAVFYGYRLLFDERAELSFGWSDLAGIVFLAGMAIPAGLTFWIINSLPAGQEEA